LHIVIYINNLYC